MSLPSGNPILNRLETWRLQFIFEDHDTVIKRMYIKERVFPFHGNCVLSNNLSIWLLSPPAVVMQLSCQDYWSCSRICYLFESWQHLSCLRSLLIMSESDLMHAECSRILRDMQLYLRHFLRVLTRTWAAKLFFIFSDWQSLSREFRASLSQADDTLHLQSLWEEQMICPNVSESLVWSSSLSFKNLVVSVTPISECRSLSLLSMEIVL